MIRKYVYAGLLLLVIAGIMFYLVTQDLNSTPIGSKNFTVYSNSIGELSLPINATAITVILAHLFTNKSTTNIYFLNQSAFNGLASYLKSNPSASAYGYVQSQKVNSSDIFTNGSSALKYLYPTSNSIASDYYLYVVVDSTHGSPSSNSILTVGVNYDSYSYASLPEAGKVELDLMVMAGILGIALVLYGVIRRQKPGVVAQAVTVHDVKKGKR